MIDLGDLGIGTIDEAICGEQLPRLCLYEGQHLSKARAMCRIAVQI